MLVVLGDNREPVHPVGICRMLKQRVIAVLQHHGETTRRIHGSCLGEKPELEHGTGEKPAIVSNRERRLVGRYDRNLHRLFERIVKCELLSEPMLRIKYARHDRVFVLSVELANSRVTGGAKITLPHKHDGREHAHNLFHI